MSHSLELNTFLSLFNATAGVGGLPLSDPDLCFWVTHEDFLDLSRWDLINQLIRLTSVKNSNDLHYNEVLSRLFQWNQFY